MTANVYRVNGGVVRSRAWRFQVPGFRYDDTVGLRSRLPMLAPLPGLNTERI